MSLGAFVRWALVCFTALAATPAGAQTAASTPSLPPPTLGPQRGPEGYADLSGTAARLGDGLKSCQVRREAAERLKCYDRLAATLAATDTTGSEEQSHAARSGAWRTETARDGSVVAGVTATSVNSDDDEWQKAPAGLFLRCRKTGGQPVTDVYVGLGSRIVKNGEPVDVLFRYGDVDGQKEPWTPSTTATAIGIWGTAHAAEVARLITHERLVSIRLELPDEKFLIASFDLLGSDKALAPVQAACGNGW